ncbi:small acid-soluble spore protein alpha/beta type [Keratinibaculum paraultunense]|uniref:Small acid-soluble spore protein alpha/beta type n=1 Tax=Keratinibaculum paraultunense TaxID=1278232 RepID=A0A4V2UUJ2_9FIRM|nr:MULTISPECIES: alpha/beta-type small acid-soluble spore protein [Bacillota]MBU5455476.1 alpha/beta-type small acid-soluble spore protein [Caproiciproducens sp. MSJ-32]QQY80446.1 alpha/beta-type small acid-soluble spore protein [Keratinibaculum paraultunense]TCS91164.1 small acid-soluble spore protein alpha/beta type [Keratinibaculum paraultunense]
MSRIDPNAIKALKEMKLEIAQELGISEDFTNKDNISSATNIFAAGPVGGLMTRRLIEIGEKQLIDEE